MHPNRSKALTEYNSALAAVREAELGTNEVAWNNANERLTIARAALVSAETEFPTPAETKRNNRELKLRNRGLDI